MVTRIHSTYTLLAPGLLSGLSCSSYRGPFIWPFLSHTLGLVYFEWKSGDLGAHTTPHVSLSISLSRPYQMGRVTLKFGPYLK